MNIMKKIITPASMIIEQTAGEFAGVWFDAARSSGIQIAKLQGQKINLARYRNDPKKFARVHLEKFIPAAIHALTQILSNPNTSEEKRKIIYDAIMERTNDEQVAVMGKAAGLPEFEKTVLFKDDNEKPKPIIIKSGKL